MRDLRLQAIDYKLKRIRFYKTIGKVVFLIVIVTLLILLLIRIDYVLKTQADTLNQIVDLRHDIDEVKENIEELNKVAINEQTFTKTALGEYTITHY